MKALEFVSTVTQSGAIALPPEIAAEIPAGEALRVVVMWEISSPDSQWRAAGRRSFEAAYSPEDAVYEQLIDDPPAR
jgi:hypothetical protein